MDRSAGAGGDIPAVGKEAMHLCQHGQGKQKFTGHQYPSGNEPDE